MFWAYSTKQRRFTRLIAGLSVVILLLGSFLPAQPAAPKAPPTVVFMTDFGVVDDSVALCKGVMYGITPNFVSWT